MGLTDMNTRKNDIIKNYKNKFFIYLFICKSIQRIRIINANNLNTVKINITYKKNYYNNYKKGYTNTKKIQNWS